MNQNDSKMKAFSRNDHLFTKSSEGSRRSELSRNKQIFYQMTSAVCTALFLFILMILALISSALRYVTTNKSLEHRGSHVYRSKEDLKLVPDLNYYYKLYGLQVDTYNVITKDGFVIILQRIVDPKEGQDIKISRKPVLLLHGLLQSSGSFCSSGKESLAYFLFQQGYDIWLGNNRCGFECRHIDLEPNDYLMWDWDIVDISEHDLTALIDQVLANSCYDKLTLIAHSQGTTQGFITLDNDRFKNCSKLNAFVALSPAVYGGKLLESKWFIKIIAKMSLNKWFFGIHSFLPIMMTMRSAIVKHKSFGFLSYTMFNFLFDWDDHLWDQDLKYRHFLFSPVYVSVKLMSWWLNDKSGFKTSKAILEDDIQWFDESTPPVFCVIPRQDKLVNGQALVNHLINVETTSNYDYIFLDNYSHLDVLWSKTVIKDVGEPIVRFLEYRNI
ncbi:hypothetical protein WICMUC_000549 [Wickerhamomyces mucosus]|uniref:Partial AB-hydrolase lipase domain-containing protein n=1 Tax=Wickerhamomyces mucosus TaxID=1378264 RepID=A0A9P8THU9_9ASCO|nr:hypothetical protein WICMUC_000549 [Wickerhamomyces mucosus]